MPGFRLAACILLVLAAVATAAEPLRLSGARIFVPVTINGIETEALLDSGAETTLVDEAFARRIGLTLAGSEIAKGTGGQQAVRFAHGVDLESVGTHLEGRTVVVMDLSDIARHVVGEPLTVVLGRELFDSGPFLLDLRAGEINAVDAPSESLGTRLPLRDHAGIKQVPVRIEGIEVHADFDLGNGSEVLIGRDFAAARGLLAPDRIVGRKTGGGVGGTVTRDLVRLRSVCLAGVEFTDVPAAIDATEHAADANVGVALLRTFVMTIDFPGNTLWLAPIHSTGTQISTSP
jgi:hypothetical protein